MRLSITFVISPQSPGCISYDLGKFLSWTVLNVFRKSSPMIKKVTFQLGSTYSFCPPEKWNKSATKAEHRLLTVLFLEYGLQEGGRPCSVRGAGNTGFFLAGVHHQMSATGWAPWSPNRDGLCAHDNTFREIINCFSSPNLPKISALASVEEKSYI